MTAFFCAVRTGLEPATLGVTGRYSNQTELPHHYDGVFLAVRTGLEPATLGVTGRYSNQTELPHQNKSEHFALMNYHKKRCKDRFSFVFCNTLNEKLCLDQRPDFFRMPAGFSKIDFDLKFRNSMIYVCCSRVLVKKLKWTLP